MTSARKFRIGCYTLEGLNSFAVVLYFNYLYFYFRDWFDFDNLKNLELAAVLGLGYTICSWLAGKLAARFGYFNALKWGYMIMAVGLFAGAQLHTAPAEIAVALVVNLGMCLIWPTLEALISEGPDMVTADAVGIYNLTWAATNALSYLVGLKLIHWLGYRCIFYLPFVLMLIQVELADRLEKLRPKPAAAPTNAHDQSVPARPGAQRAQTFQKMAWLANPFSYLAVNTLLAVMPGLVETYHLSPLLAGMVCSLWCFVRVGVFYLLWQWPGWHYRFLWLAGAYLLLVASFATILLAPTLVIMFLAEAGFGAAAGLIYYSSLFYAMDASDSKSEHGGIHEAAIGLGNCAGPAVGAAALQFLPHYPGSGNVAVTLLLLGGFGGLLAIRHHIRKNLKHRGRRQ